MNEAFEVEKDSNRGRLLDNVAWSSVLIQAMPYFKEWCGKTIVIKYGGNAMLNEELKQGVAKDIVLLHTIGVQVVLVHGGGPEINKMLERVGKKSEFSNGLRITDAETMEIAEMVLTGKLNKDIVSLLTSEGGLAAGISGVDGRLLEARRLESVNGQKVDLGYVGEIVRVNAEIVLSLLNENFIPVISTVGISEDGSHSYNINADTAAAKIAVALKAEKFVELTNVAGVLEDINDPSSLIARIPLGQVKNLIANGVISSGMIPKVECCMTALKGGVKRTHIIDGRVMHSLLLEMFSDRGVGTMIY